MADVVLDDSAMVSQRHVRSTGSDHVADGCDVEGGMIIVTGSVRARPEALQEVLHLSLEHVHRSRLEAGCLLHSVHQDVEDANRVVFLEHWLDRDALAAHFRLAASVAFAKSVRDLATEPPALDIYDATRTEL